MVSREFKLNRPAIKVLEVIRTARKPLVLPMVDIRAWVFLEVTAP